MRKVTRCPNCATRFKVVPDQLRISQGWVRCGVCREIFDATQHLVSTPSRSKKNTAAVPPVSTAQEDTQAAPLARQTPVDRSPASAFPKTAAPAGDTPPSVPQVSQSPAAPVQAAAHQEAAAETTDKSGVPPDTAPLTQWLTQWPVTQTFKSSVPAKLLHEDLSGTDSLLAHMPVNPLPARRTSAAQPGEVPAEKPRTHKRGGRSDRGHTTKSERTRRQRTKEVARGHFALPDSDFTWPQSILPQEEAEQLSFVRQARQRQLWRRPVVRAALALACTMAGTALAAQIAQHQRDALAAYHPVLRPALHALCRITGCTVRLHREIAAIDNTSSFWRVPRSEHYYQWNLALENRSAVTVAMPTLELTLTDAQGTPVLRRVVHPDEIDAPPQLAAHSTWNAEIPVAVREEVSKYIANSQTLAFYP